jgi:hypothetical protein
MKRALLLTMRLVGGGTAASAAPTGGFGLELGGRGLVYSLNYSQMIGEQAAIGIGVEVLPHPCGDCDSFIALPVYANAYFLKGSSSPFVTAGITALLGSDALAIPTVGFGYEMRDHKGRTVRLTVYAIGVRGQPRVWVGLGIGGH